MVGVGIRKMALILIREISLPTYIQDIRAEI